MILSVRKIGHLCSAKTLLPAALALIEHQLTNRRVNLHGKHPLGTPPSLKRGAYQWPDLTPPAAPSWRRSIGRLCRRRVHHDRADKCRERPILALIGTAGASPASRPSLKGLLVSR